MPSPEENLCLSSYAAFQTGDFERASRLAASALKIRRNSAVAHHLNAASLRELGRYKEAEYSLQQARQLDPGNPDHIFLEGLILWGSGTVDTAEERLFTAIRISPRRTDFRLDYATFLIHQRRFEDALQAASEAAKINGHDPKIKLVLECARERVWRPELDNLSYKPPLPMDQSWPEAYIQLGSIYLEGGFADLALEQFSRALSLDDANTRAKALFITAAKVLDSRLFRNLWSFSRLMMSPLPAAIVLLGVASLFFLYISNPEYQSQISAILILLLVVFLGVPIGFQFLGHMFAGSYERVKAERAIAMEAGRVAAIKARDAALDTLGRVQRLKSGRFARSLSRFFIIICLILLVALIILVNLPQGTWLRTRMQEIMILKVGCAITLCLSFLLALSFHARAMRYGR